MHSQLDHPDELRPGVALARAGVRPRKSRGQNFLVQASVARRIVAAAALSPNDAVVEIGPGLGILSDLIVAHPITALTLVEVDEQLAAALQTRFQGDHRVRIIIGDFLDAELRAIANDRKITVISNLPFNVAAAILERLCDYRDLIARMVLMFQREVADRIRATPGMREHCALSAYTALYWDIVEHFPVAAGNFHPRPKVDASVLVFKPKPHPGFRPEDERAILATIRAAFAAPRKTIRNSLAGGLRCDPDEAARALEHAQIDPAARPGMLAAGDFVKLAEALHRPACIASTHDA